MVARGKQESAQTKKFHSRTEVGQSLMAESSASQNKGSPLLLGDVGSLQNN